MLRLCSLPSEPPVDTYDNNTIFYNFVGNFVPPEWRDLQANDGKALSKTAKQLLSLVVFLLQVCYNSGNHLQEDELQESYHFFEQSLGVCQRRIRQCILELQEGGFIHLYNATIVKQHVKCRNTPGIKLAKKFQPYQKKFSGEAERNFVSTRKKFQAHNIIDINNKSNISRSSESEFLKNVHKQNESIQGQEQKSPQEQIEQHQEQAELPVAPSCQESHLRNCLKHASSKAKAVLKRILQYDSITDFDCYFPTLLQKL